MGVARAMPLAMQERCHGSHKSDAIGDARAMPWESQERCHGSRKSDTVGDAVGVTGEVEDTLSKTALFDKLDTGIFTPTGRSPKSSISARPFKVARFSVNVPGVKPV